MNKELLMLLAAADGRRRGPVDLQEALMRIHRLLKVQTVAALELHRPEWPTEGKDPACARVCEYAVIATLKVFLSCFGP